MEVSLAAASINYSMAQTQQAAGIALMKDAMDAQAQQMDAMVRQLNQITSFGHQLDILI